MPPDSLVLNLKFVQGGTNAKPQNVISNAIAHKAYAATGGTHIPTLTQRPTLRNGTAYNTVLMQ